MRLIEFKRSNNPNKRFMAKFMEPERTIYFGSNLHLNTYIDHGNVDIRDRHLMRRRSLDKDNVIDEETMVTGVLWGPTRSVEGNLSRFLNFFRIEDDR